MSASTTSSAAFGVSAAARVGANFSTSTRRLPRRLIRRLRWQPRRILRCHRERRFGSTGGDAAGEQSVARLTPRSSNRVRLMRRVISPDDRRAMMASIRSTNTKPELAVRRALTRLGLRYRLHAIDLPGHPDVVMRRRRSVIFVHGCLWHLHDGCRLARVPKTRPEYWPAKLERNKQRDRRNQEELICRGWTVIVVWECETADPKKLEDRLRQLFSL